MELASNQKLNLVWQIERTYLNFLKYYYDNFALLNFFFRLTQNSTEPTKNAELNWTIYFSLVINFLESKRQQP